MKKCRGAAAFEGGESSFSHYRAVCPHILHFPPEFLFFLPRRLELTVSRQRSTRPLPDLRPLYRGACGRPFSPPGVHKDIITTGLSTMLKERKRGEETVKASLWMSTTVCLSAVFLLFFFFDGGECVRVTVRRSLPPPAMEPIVHGPPSESLRHAALLLYDV